MVSCHSYKILTKSRQSSPIPFLKYFVPNYSWRDAIISTNEHVYLRHRKADLSLVKLTRAHDLLFRANEFVSRAHDIKYFTYMSLLGLRTYFILQRSGRRIHRSGPSQL